jgi:hypothetical protein
MNSCMPSAASCAMRDFKSFAPHAVQCAEVLDVLAGRQIVVEPVACGITPRCARALDVSPRMSMPSMQALPLSGVKHAVQHAQAGGLAGAVGAEQTRDLAVARGEGHVVRRLDAAEMLASEAHCLDHGAGPGHADEERFDAVAPQARSHPVLRIGVFKKSAIKRGMQLTFS